MMMSLAAVDPKSAEKKRDHAQQLKDLSDEAMEIFQLHEDGAIDADEAASRLNELKTRHRTFLDRLIG